MGSSVARISDPLKIVPQKGIVGKLHPLSQREKDVPARKPVDSSRRGIKLGRGKVSRRKGSGGMSGPGTTSKPGADPGLGTA
jgi:hypothetical protein